MNTESNHETILKGKKKIIKKIEQKKRMNFKNDKGE